MQPHPTRMASIFPPFGCNFGHSQFCGSRPPLASFFSPNPNLYRTYRKVLLPKIRPLLNSQAGKHLVARSLAFSPHNYHAQGRFSQVPTGYRKVLVHPCGAHAHLYSLHPAPTSCAEVLKPTAMPRLFLGHAPTHCDVEAQANRRHPLPSTCLHTVMQRPMPPTSLHAPTNYDAAAAAHANRRHPPPSTLRACSLQTGVEGVQ